MISARQFCRDREYPITIFLTYTFDPLFFERIPWTDLAVGGSRRIVIVADGGQVAEAMRRCIGQLAHLGRRYVLAETVVPNTFHPKLIARLSENGGRVWIGSGNLSYTGWGGNREIATSWSIGPGEEDSGVWLDETLNVISGFVRSASYSDHLRAIREEVPWLSGRQSVSGNGPVLVGLPERPLAQQLADRWRGRRFDEIKVCTGSTDTDGAFLLWAHRTFGLKRAIVCVTPSSASFDPAQLAKLPLDVRIVRAAPAQVMHAKFYWFSGQDGQAAIVGSANCSAAAWLLGGGRGNVELVVPYDQPSAEEFSSILGDFDGEAESPQEVLAPRARESGDEASDTQAAYRLASVRCRAAGLIEAVVEPAPSTGARVTLSVHSGPNSATVTLTPQSRVLVGRLPVEFNPGSITSFAVAQVITGDESYVTEPHWIDDEILLERASNPRRLDPNLQDLARKSPFASDEQRILASVQAVSAQLLNDSSRTIRDGGSRKRAVLGYRGSDRNGTNMAPAIDPSSIIRSLHGLRLQNRGGQFGRLAAAGGTLQGVISLLFAEQGESEVDLTHETWTGDGPEENPYSVSSNADRSNVSKDGQSPSPRPSSAEALGKFREQLQTFLREMAKPRFAEICEAERLVQALAFPLLLCIRGTEWGWLPETELGSVAARVVQIMLEQPYGAGKPRGLLAMVRHRYALMAKEDEFRRAVGEGTLWAALLAALAHIPPAPLRAVIRQAAALTAVFRCGELLAVADAEHVISLIKGSVIKNAEMNITERVARIADAMALLTGTLTGLWEITYKEQGCGRRLQSAGSILWNQAWGWAIAPSSPAQAYHQGYINLELAAMNHRQIAQVIAYVVATCAEPAGAHGSPMGENREATQVEAISADP